MKTIAEKFEFEKRQIVKELRKHGILSVLTAPENHHQCREQILELKAKAGDLRYYFLGFTLSIKASRSCIKISVLPIQNSTMLKTISFAGIINEMAALPDCFKRAKSNFHFLDTIKPRIKNGMYLLLRYRNAIIRKIASEKGFCHQGLHWYFCPDNNGDNGIFHDVRQISIFLCKVLVSARKNLFDWNCN